MIPSSRFVFLLIPTLNRSSYLPATVLCNNLKVSNNSSILVRELHSPLLRPLLINGLKLFRTSNGYPKAKDNLLGYDEGKRLFALSAHKIPTRKIKTY